MKDVADRFLRARKVNGLSQQDFAYQLGISLRAEQSYERGEREIPAKVLLQLAKIFDVDPMWVLDGTGDTPRLLTGDIDLELLAKAQDAVDKVMEITGKKFEQPARNRMVARAYRFYTSKNSENSEIELMAGLLQESM